MVKKKKKKGCSGNFDYIFVSQTDKVICILLRNMYSHGQNC